MFCNQLTRSKSGCPPVITAVDRMKCMYRIVFTIFCLISLDVYGTTYSTLTVAQLYEHAGFVGLVEITEGHTLGRGDDSCGASYTGYVLEQHKGQSKDEIQLGHQYGLEIGSKYLVFLASPGKEKRFLMSTNSFSERGRSQELGRCSAQRTAWTVVHSGFGALKLTWAHELKFKKGFSVPTKYIRFPDEIEKIEADIGEREKHKKFAWIKKRDVLEYVKSLRDGSD